MIMIDVSGLQQAILALPDRVEKALMAYGETGAKKVESRAKRDRPWTDRTGHARQRLNGKCIRTARGIRIILAHGVEYGIYLEFAREKRYAIIYPTLTREAPDLFRGLQGLFDRLGAFA